MVEEREMRQQAAATRLAAVVKARAQERASRAREWARRQCLLRPASCRCAGSG